MILRERGTGKLKSERRSDGNAKAGTGREEERPEGEDRSEAEADDRESAEEHAPRPPAAGTAGPSAGRPGRTRTREPQSGAALRAGEEEEHRRPLEDGQVGPDQGASQGMTPRNVLLVALEPVPEEQVQEALALFHADEILVAGSADEKTEAALRNLGLPISRVGGGEVGGEEATGAEAVARGVAQGRREETPFLVVGTVAAFIFAVIALISLIAFLVFWLA